MLTKPLILPTQEEGGFLADINSSFNSIFDPVVEWSGKIIFFQLEFLRPVLGDIVDMPFVVMWLLAAAVIITVYLGFIQLRGLKTAYEVVRGRFSSADDPGEIPHYQALTSAVSGTVGLGNIAGVGAAVVLGGPGATFWMVLAGIFGMATKFAECTLGVKYRTVYEDGTVSGGPFKYLPVAFNKLPKVIAVGLTGLFAIAILIFGVGGGNMFQANQTLAQTRSVTGGEDGFLGSDGAAIIFGIVLATIIGLVILGGIRSIGKVTSTLVPFMGGLYVIACLTVIILDISNLPAAVGEIVGGAFNPDALAGGFVGVLIVGLTRAAFSNEAGLGSAPIAHSAVKTRRPVSEGFVALFEPFLDTVVICSMTALTIIIADAPSYQATREGLAADSNFVYDGVTITSDAFGSTVSWFPTVLAIAVALFAISTLITWSYYGNKAWNYLLGESKISDIIYRIVFLFFTVAGCALSFGALIDFTNNILFLCAFINLLGVYFMLPTIKREMNEYFADRKSGRLYELGKGDQDKDVSADQI